MRRRIRGSGDMEEWRRGEESGGGGGGGVGFLRNSM